MKEEAKKAAVYCRVSTYEQGQGDFSSLKGQEDLLREYCKNKQWDIADVYIDRASGSSLERNEIKRLLSDAEERKFNVVLATKLDRISRSVIDYLDVDKRLNELNIDIVFATQNIDTTTPAGKMQRNIMLSFAEFERDMIAERTREKLYYQASKGFWGGGHAPLGYDVKNKLLEINLEEAELVKKIFQYYLEEPSLNRVAQRLNREGFRNKTRVKIEDQKEKVRGGGKFNSTSVYRILQNKAYIGKISFKNEEFAGLHKPILENDIFDKVQKQLNVSRTSHITAQENSQLILLGILFCDYCGNNMTTSFATKKDGSRYYYYKCTHKSKYGSSSCESRDISAEEIELFVEKLVQKISSSKKLFDSVFKQLGQNQKSDLTNYEKERKRFINNKNNIEKQINNILTAIGKGNFKDSDIISQKLQELQAERDLIRFEISKVENELQQIKNTSIEKKVLRQIFDDFNSIYEEASPEQKKYMIKTLIREIRIKLGKKEKTGEIEVFFRGDGNIKKEWASKNTDPEKLASSYCVAWLREQDSNLQPSG